MSNKKKSISILELSRIQARNFLLQPSSYCDIDLPQYIDFKKLLKNIDIFLKKNDFRDCTGQPDNFENINHVILNNKDGRYAWRPFQLIHPVMYVSLVHEMTTKEAWNTIIERFKEFSKNEQITCVSIPVKSLSKQKNKAEQITNWWHLFEQKSIELALDYEYLLETDITDCYGSIYTHSIPWALHTKKNAKKKENRNNKSLIGNIIDFKLRGMQHGQTNGIPQGAVLMDFIAEMVLGYADLKLTEKIGETISDYHILRYRDDYRIFVNNPKDGEMIIKYITEVMIGLGLKLHPNKTKASEDVIESAIKKDKLNWLYRKQIAKSLQKRLFIIHNHAKTFPNSGSLAVALKNFYKKIAKKTKIREDVLPLISIVVDIVFRNPRTYPMCSAILSKLLTFIEDTNYKNEIMGKIKKKFTQIPNTGYLQIWLQRVTLSISSEISYDEPICKIVYGDKGLIWNHDWIKAKKLLKILDKNNVVDQNQINKLSPVIKMQEVELFKDLGY